VSAGIEESEGKPQEDVLLGNFVHDYRVDSCLGVWTWASLID
jgi:hypothetical protein